MECNWDVELKKCYDRRIKTSNVYRKGGFHNRICPALGESNFGELKTPTAITNTAKPLGNKMTRYTYDDNLYSDHTHELDKCIRLQNCTQCMENFREYKFF